MKLKNTKELVLRARGHARADHIKQGTYGDGAVNGQLRFKGCAIGCYATPHRKPELRSWLRKVFGGPGSSFGTYGNGYTDEPMDMLKRVQKEFGLSVMFMRCVESIFENIPTHGAAINFLPAVAEALAEKGDGYDLSARKVRSLWNYATDGNGRIYTRSYPRSFGVTQGYDDPLVTRDRFLDRLRSL